ncbi:MAG: hypothetical protein ACRBHB_08220 [Arenicella sp.]
MRKRLILLFLTIFLISCGTTYQKHTWSGGYKDVDLGEGKYLVEYYGNGTLSPETVQAYWEQRANDICPKGYSTMDDEEGENDGGIFISPLVTVEHPWIKGVIKCH